MRRPLAFLLGVIILTGMLGNAGAHASGFVPFADLLARDEASRNVLLPYCEGSSGLYGYMNGLGEPVIGPRFEAAGRFIAGRAWIVTGGKYGYIDASGDPAVPAALDEASDFDPESGLARVRYRGREAVLNLDGELYTGLTAAFEPADGMMRIERDGLFGFLGPGGLVIEPQWKEAHDFSDGLANVMTDPDGELYGFIDKSGQTVLSGYEMAGNFLGGRAWASKQEEEGFIDKSGALVLAAPEGGAGVYGFSSGLALCVGIPEGGGSPYYYYIGEDGNAAFPARFDGGESFADGCARVMRDRKFGLIDARGNELLPCEYDSIAPMADGRAVVGKNGRYGYTDAAGRLVLPLEYDAARDFADGFAWVRKGGREMMIDRDGNEVLPSAAQAPGSPSPLPESTPAPSPAGEPEPAPEPTPTPVPEPTSAAFPTISRGDEADGAKDYVAAAQRALIEKGYLKGRADGNLGLKTERALALYQEKNGLDVTGALDALTYAALEQDEGGEASVFLMFGSEPQARWKSRPGGWIDFRVRLTNADDSRTVKSFKLCYYLEDAGGARHPEQRYKYKTFDNSIKPGQSRYSAYAGFEGRDVMTAIYVGISEVRYANGKRVAIDPNDIRFFRWDLTW